MCIFGETMRAVLVQSPKHDHLNWDAMLLAKYSHPLINCLIIMTVRLWMVIYECINFHFNWIDLRLLTWLIFRGNNPCRPMDAYMHLWFRYWHVAYLTQSHNLDQSWFLIKQKTTIALSFNQIAYICFQQNAFQRTIPKMLTRSFHPQNIKGLLKSFKVQVIDRHQ